MNRLWQKDSPIVTSLLETDVYKFLMMYFIWQYFPNLQVRFAFTNRTTSVPLARELDLGFVREQLAHTQTLRFSGEELAFLRSWQMFPEEFLTALTELRLPSVEVRETKESGELRVEVSGTWFETTLWELYVLPIISEARMRFQIGERTSVHREIIVEGERRLREKIEVLKDLRWKVLLFDLRRRLSRDWEAHTSRMLLEEVPERISGLSNVKRAMEHGVEPQGTSAHELPMALAALRGHEGPDAVQHSVFEVLEKWESLYAHKARIMLTDTFGSEWFLQNVPQHYLRYWRGVRQDSGDPFAFARMCIQRYGDLNIDPRSKLVIFSDGLTVVKMEALERTFYGSILGAFGWGTNKVHDVPHIQPLSMVMKLVEAAGRPAVKLSDNLAKAIGDPSEVKRMKRIFQHTVTFKEEPTY